MITKTTSMNVAIDASFEEMNAKLVYNYSYND